MKSKINLHIQPYGIHAELGLHWSHITVLNFEELLCCKNHFISATHIVLASHMGWGWEVHFGVKGQLIGHVWKR